MANAPEIEDEWLDLLGLLYRAALAEEDWQQVLAGVATGTLASAAELESLGPHLERVAQIHQRLRQADGHPSAGWQLLERLPIGVLWCDGEGRVHRANRKARELLSETAGGALGLRQDHLRARSAEKQRELKALFDQVSSRSEDHSWRGGALRLDGGGPATPETRVLLLPFAESPDVRSLAGTWDPVVLVLVSDGSGAGSGDPALLRDCYQLTAAEARLAELLLRGLDIDECSRSLGIRRNTARTHLRSLFRKTGTCRQPELVRLLLTLPTPAPWSDP